MVSRSSLREACCVYIWNLLKVLILSALDLKLISFQLEIVELPKEKKYLLKYFDTPIQIAFLKYIHVFGDYKNFTDHTGLSCQFKWLKSLYDKLRKIEKMHKEAKSNMDLETLERIETGKQRFPRKLPENFDPF